MTISSYGFWIVMVAIKAKTLKKIKAVQGEVEPHIVDMIKCSDEQSCPYKVLKLGNYESEEAKNAVAKIARMLYKTGLLTKLDMSLADDEAFDTLLYAFGYWGGQTLYRHGSDICQCQERCY